MNPETDKITKAMLGIARARFAIALYLMSAIALTGCAPETTPTPFIPPSIVTATGAPSATVPAPQPAAASPTVPPAPSATVEVACNADLTFVQDLTVPDGSVILPGGSIDKQWLVQNSGTCDWNADYRFKLVAGDSLGALNEQALYPARAGTQVTLRILFTAPLESGTYQSAWQAFTPDGSVFGEAVYMQIIVGP